jgi:hypothetical protein
MNVLREASQEMKPPRACFLDFPLGCPAGKPHEPAQQREIVRAAFKLTSECDADRWEVKTLPFQCSPDGSRAWEKEVDELYRNGGMNVVVNHIQAHRARGESLVGHEREYAIKRNS